MFNRREIQNAGTPVPLFALSPNGYYEIAADGRRFPVNIIPAEQGFPQLCRPVNRTSMLKQWVFSSEIRHR